MFVFAIDPGNVQSAYALMDNQYTILSKGKSSNEEVMDCMNQTLRIRQSVTVVIEKVACYGMPVGREVFDTCEWIGRFSQQANSIGCTVEYIFRMDEKMNLCHNSKAKDGNIRTALIERFAKHDLKNGKGTKKNPDVFYGVSKDIWAAIAVAVTYLDKIGESTSSERNKYQ